VAFKGIGITITRKYSQSDFVAEPRALKKNPEGTCCRAQALKKNPEGSCFRAQALKKESQRDSVTQPRVAHPRETLGKTGLTHNPKGVAP